MIATKQYPIKLLLRILLFLSISVTLLFFTRSQYHNQTLHLIHISFTTILIAGFFYELFNPIPNIRFYDDRLTFKTLTRKKTYLHTDIEKIIYTDREHWFHLLRKVYSTCIIFKNGDFVFIHQNNCKNYIEVEQHLKTIVLSESPKSVENIMRHFKGSIFFSISGFVISFTTFIILKGTDEGAFSTSFMIFSISIFILILYVNAFIIGISKDKLYIKSLLTFFIFNRFQLDDLINVRYETIGKLTRLRVWRRNNEWKRYYFFTLSNRSLRELAIVLRARGIQVIDDVTL